MDSPDPPLAPRNTALHPANLFLPSPRAGWVKVRGQKWQGRRVEFWSSQALEIWGQGHLLECPLASVALLLVRGSVKRVEVLKEKATHGPGGCLH